MAIPVLCMHKMYVRNRKFLDAVTICDCKASVLSHWWSRQESNLDLEFRKLLFYPLNYGTGYY
jgi:hypothetical protein